MIHTSGIIDRIPVSEPFQCSYFSDRRAQSRTIRCGDDIAPDDLETLLERGYRRCGDIYYEHVCPACRLCINYRIDVQQFAPSRSLARVIKRNHDVQLQWGSPTATTEKERIYLRYQYAQHFLKSPVPPGESAEFIAAEKLETMRFQMYTNPGSTKELEIRLDDRLIGFGILDVGTRTVSAVYFVFDPDFAHRSLGSLAILAGIQWAKENGFQYYHLGYYIPGHPKMDYKKRFRGGQVLIQNNGGWSDRQDDAEAFVRRVLAKRAEEIVVPASSVP